MDTSYVTALTLLSLLVLAALAVGIWLNRLIEMRRTRERRKIRKVVRRSSRSHDAEIRHV